MLLRSNEEGRGQLALFYDKQASTDMCSTFARFVYEHLQQRALAGSVQSRSIFICKGCGFIVSDQLVQLVQHKGLKSVECPVPGCNKDIPLYEEEENDLTINDYSVISMNLAADDQRKLALNISTKRADSKIKMNKGDFDVLFCYNEIDLPQVMRIAEDLKDRGIAPWLSAEQSQIGFPLLLAVEQKVERFRSAAVFIGKKGLDITEQLGLRTLLQQFVTQRQPLIPVLLQGASGPPTLLENFTLVDFRKPFNKQNYRVDIDQIDEKDVYPDNDHSSDVDDSENISQIDEHYTDALERLIQGITGEHIKGTEKIGIGKLNNSSMKTSTPAEKIFKGIQPMTPLSKTPVEVFYSYAHEDEVLRNELEKHLSLLKQQGLIDAWHDREIGAGTEWQQEIDTHLNSAGIILLLISPDFMSSDYCSDIEVKRAMERHRAGAARVIPIILRRVDWHGAVFGKLQALPMDGKPVSQWLDRDDAFYEIVKGIRKVIEELLISALPQFGSVEPNLEQLTANRPTAQAQSELSNKESKFGLERPATAFLSYEWEDAEEIKYLQQQLKIQGVRAWRDVTDLLLGGANNEEIIYTIKNESDAFVIYFTEHSFKSHFIWTIELPTALERWERDHTFNIIPILQGITFDQLEQFCSENGYRSPRDFNCVSLPEKATSATDEEFNKQLKLVARRIMETTLALRLRRVGANRKYEPCICFQTHNYEPPTESLDLDVDWTGFFPSKDELPTEKVWDEVLLPALDDVKQVLSTKTPSHRLHVFVQAHLPAAFAFGFAFPAAAHFTLLIEGRHGIWSTEGSASIPDPLRHFSYEKSGDAHVAVMEIAIARDTASGVAKSLQMSGLSFKHHIRFDLLDGADHLSGVRDAAHALAISHQIGRELRRLQDQKGVSHIHLFAALPAALAVMVSHQMNALSAITLYHYMEKDGLYVSVCTLGK
jgi:hypothetical protein